MLPSSSSNNGRITNTKLAAFLGKAKGELGSTPLWQCSRESLHWDFSFSSHEKKEWKRKNRKRRFCNRERAALSPEKITFTVTAPLWSLPPSPSPLCSSPILTDPVMTDKSNGRISYAFPWFLTSSVLASFSKSIGEEGQRGGAFSSNMFWEGEARKEESEKYAIEILPMCCSEEEDSCMLLIC